MSDGSFDSSLRSSSGWTTRRVSSRSESNTSRLMRALSGKTRRPTSTPLLRFCRTILDVMSESETSTATTTLRRSVANKKNQYQVPKKIQEMDPKDYWTSVEYQNDHRFMLYWTHD